jgi:hypothetical protein
MVPDALGQMKTGAQVYPAVVGSGVGMAMAGAGAVLGSPGLTKEGLKLNAGSTRVGAEALDPTLNPASPGAVQANIPANGAPPAPVPGAPTGVDPAQQMAMKMAATMPGGFKIARPDPAAMQQYDESVEAARAAGKLSRENIKEAAETFKTESNALFEANKQKMVDAEALAVQASEFKQTHAREAARYNTAKMNALQAAREAASTPTDPNRFWNNKPDGQKAMSVLAGALFGFTGQGMQWLQRLDTLVENDVKMQQADRASKVAGLRDEAQGLGEAAQFAMQQGATLAEAKLIERQAKYESAKSYLEQIAMRSNNAQLQMRAQGMIQDIVDKQLATDTQGVQLAEMRASNENTARAANARLAQQKAEFGVKVGMGAGAGGKPREMSPALVTKLAATQRAVRALEEMKRLAENGGFLDRATRRVKENLTSEEAANVARYKQLGFAVATEWANSTLQGAEQEYLLPLTGERSARLDATPLLDNALKFAAQSYVDFQSGAEQATSGNFDEMRKTAEEYKRKYGAGQRALSTERPVQ